MFAWKNFRVQISISRFSREFLHAKIFAYTVSDISSGAVCFVQSTGQTYIEQFMLFFFSKKNTDYYYTGALLIYSDKQIQ